MIAPSLQSTPAPEAQAQSWRSLLALAAYRWVIAIFLTALYYTGRINTFLGGEVQPALFEAACIVYLLLCIPATLTLLLRRPGLHVQPYAHALLDVVALTALVYAGGGVTTGLGMLLITPVAGVSLLLPRRMAILCGAIASLGLLGEEIYRHLQLDEEAAHFIQTGMLGGLYLFSAFVANTLSQRVLTSEALAARRKVALDNLAQINERIIANMQIGVLVVDADGRIRLLNQAACQLLNVRPSATRRLLALEAPALFTELAAWRRRLQLDAEPATVDVEHRSLLVHFNRLGPEPDAPTLVFVEDAGRIGEQAQQMKLASLGRLTASIAHQIRNPLGAISHAGQLLSENLPDQTQDRRLLDIIHRHTGRINSIIEDILRLSRRSDTVPETIHLRPWLEQLIHDYREPKSTIAPRFDLDMVSPAAEVRADPSQLRQVLMNIWDNAVMHAGLPPEQLVIRLGADHWPESGRVYLDICDNGRGIAPEAASQIFEPFFTTTRMGTGLGLYIARELCECNHARLSHIPAVGGAHFRIVFANPAEWLEQAAVAGGATINSG